MEGPPLYDMFCRTIPEERCTAVEELMCRGTNYVMGFACRGWVFGNVGINMKKGMELKNRETIEALIH